MARFIHGIVVGAIATPLLLLCTRNIWPLYTNMRAESETSAWLAHIQLVQSAIEENAIRQKSLRGAGENISKEIPSMLKIELDVFEITESGIIILRGGSDRQVVILIPSLAEERVIWRCVGGSRNAMPKQCRKL